MTLQIPVIPQKHLSESAFFSVIIATCLGSNSQNIKKTFEDSYIRAATMLPQTASNNSGFR